MYFKNIENYNKKMFYFKIYKILYNINFFLNKEKRNLRNKNILNDKYYNYYKIL